MLYAQNVGPSQLPSGLAKHSARSHSHPVLHQALASIFGNHGQSRQFFLNEKCISMFLGCDCCRMRNVSSPGRDIHCLGTRVALHRLNILLLYLTNNNR